MRKTSRPWWLPLGGALLPALGGISGCSLVFHVDPAQCSSDGDCTARGSAFTGYVCRQQTCVARSTLSDAAADGSVGSGGGGGAGGTTGLEDAGDVASGADVADSRDAPEAEASSVLPEADTSTSVECSSTADCVAANITHPEVACDLGSGKCLQLTTDDCPFVLGEYKGNVTPLFLGAFATLPASSPQNHPSYLNYALAIDEFTYQGGIPAWDPAKSSTGLRMPVIVVCNAEGEVSAAVNHLKNDVGVPGMVAALDSVTLRTTMVNDATGLFVVNAFGANSTLTSLSDITSAGLLWHMLGQPSDNAPAYAAFVPHLESHLRASQSLGTSPLRIATITAKATDTSDLASAVLGVLRWNGMSVTENTAAGYYKNINLDSVLGDNDLQSIDTSTAVSSLLDFKPHVIVSFASSEFVKLLQVLEVQLQTSTYASVPKPFYLIGPYNMVSQDLLTWVHADNSQLEQRKSRIAGIGVASTSDAHVLTAYENRFLGEYPSGQSSLGQENYYDAMYFLVYSVVGAGRLQHLTGTNLGQGMLRLLSGTSYDMGPSAMGNVFGALGAPSGTISLFGTLGAPNFTISTGARVGEGSVYCIAGSAEAGAVNYAYDVQRVVSATDGGTPGLQGTFPCYSLQGQ